jgi:hypothetical protein
MDHGRPVAKHAAAPRAVAMRKRVMWLGRMLVGAILRMAGRTRRWSSVSWLKVTKP